MVFCLCFVMFKGLTKLRGTATEQENLQGAYSFLLLVAHLLPSLYMRGTR